MNAPASTLFEMQAALQAWLMHGDTAVAARLGEERKEQRLRIYADAYRLRLGEVLANDFPVLSAWIGKDAFDALAEAYLRAHPSRQPSVRDYGRQFAGWLESQPETGSGWAQLAEFEWLQGEAFDATDASTASIESVAVLPAQAWPSLRLQLQPSLRLCTLPVAIPALVEAHNAGRALPASVAGDVADWLLWRRDFEVFWRRLDTDEAELLAMARDGACFAELCATLAIHLDADAAALRVATLLKRWLADGLVAAIDTEPSA